MKKAQEQASFSEVEELEKVLLLQEKIEKVRVSFLLPKKLILLMDEVAQGKSRSKLALRAILKEIKEKKVKEEKKKKRKLDKKLEKELVESYQARTKEDPRVAQEWFGLEEEAWKTWQKNR